MASKSGLEVAGNCAIPAWHKIWISLDQTLTALNVGWKNCVDLGPGEYASNNAGKRLYDLHEEGAMLIHLVTRFLCNVRPWQVILPVPILFSEALANHAGFSGTADFGCTPSGP